MLFLNLITSLCEYKRSIIGWPLEEDFSRRERAFYVKVSPVISLVYSDNTFIVLNPRIMH